jgi:hypothetical protein
MRKGGIQERNEGEKKIKIKERKIEKDKRCCASLL